MADEMGQVFAEAARRQVFPSRWQRPAHLVGRLAARPWWSLDLLPVRAMGAAHQLTQPGPPNLRVRGEIMALMELTDICLYVFIVSRPHYLPPPNLPGVAAEQLAFSQHATTTIRKGAHARGSRHLAA
eukprot:COSAG01_NODE_13596_length_1562_cov_1.419002_2_plen_128_part_00